MLHCSDSRGAIPGEVSQAHIVTGAKLYFVENGGNKGITVALPSQLALTEARKAAPFRAAQEAIHD
jgi:hypothetical protein